MTSRLLRLLRRSLGTLTLTLATLLGAVAFLYPFFVPRARTGHSFVAHSTDAPLTFLLLLLLCLIVVIANLETQQMNSKIVAVLGILVAINAALRLNVCQYGIERDGVPIADQRCHSVKQHLDALVRQDATDAQEADRFSPTGVVAPGEVLLLDVGGMAEAHARTVCAKLLG